MILKTRPADFNKKFDVVGCFLLCNGEFVLLQRQLHKPSGGTWGLPAGKKEPNETLQQAMRRELQEETGLDITENSLKYVSSHCVRQKGVDFEWHMFLIDFDAKPKIIINNLEHSDYQWVTKERGIAIENPIHDLKESIELFYENSGK